MAILISPNKLALEDRATLDPVQLEKLDHLISRLKDRRIYTNLNLHVGRMYPGRPTWASMPSHFKGLDNFDEAMIRDQMNFARDLHTHVNLHTKNRYADDPAIAIFEITNENALLHEWSKGGLDQMPEPYAADLHRCWNDFLASRYPINDSLEEAWSVKHEPLGREFVSNQVFSQGLTGWNLEQQSQEKRGKKHSKYRYL